MRRYEHLSAPPSVVAELLRQLPKQSRIELVLRFLHSQEWVRFRVVEQNQIREHLDRAVGHVSREEGILEAAVLEPQREATVHGGLGFDGRDARHPRAHHLQNAPESVRVVLVQKPGHLGDIVTASREVLRVPCLGTRPGVVDMEIGNVPALQQVAELRGGSELLELTETLDRQRARILEINGALDRRDVLSVC